MTNNSPCFFGISPAPGFQASFEITNRCNLSCLHCCNNSSQTADTGLSGDKICELLKQLKNAGLNSLYITGGEPTQHPDFRKILPFLKTIGLDATLATNGYIDEAVVPLIKEGVCHEAGVFVSMDGIGDAHDRFRGKQGSYQRTLSAIRAFVSAGLRTRVSATIWKGNLDQVFKMAELAKSLGAYQVHFSSLCNAGRVTTNQEILLSRAEYVYALESVKHAAETLAADGFSVTSRRNARLAPGSDRCEGGGKVLHITAQGDIYPCSWMAKCQGGKEYTLRWNGTNLEDCLQSAGRFKKIVDARCARDGYSACPAMASLSKDLMGPDPLNDTLKSL
ncbi:MAG: radical SAM protein [Elusimicrobia bacterium]|nr:radical SAM protein [Elusimicrobiota bacterium]